MEPTLPLNPNLAGKLLGNYRLVTAIGSGGMGTVYYAEHAVIGRRAAIKVLHPEISRDANVLSRFLTEARAVNGIRHPNVVEITDFGQQDDLHYIVMNLLEGETLGERLERIRVCDERTTIRVGCQVASALGAAHEREIVHRDLKPENIFLTNHPEFPDYVKVLDFGVAKLLGEKADISHKTGLGIAVGTPKYMSPEQCRGDGKLDCRSDIYALGLVIYQMLVGETPFTQTDLIEVMRAHLFQMPVPVIEHNPQISPRLNAVVMRALEKAPEKRFATMRELREALEGPDSRTEISPSVGVPAVTVERTAAPRPPRDKDAPVREARPVANKLAEIVRLRIATDRLVIPTMPTVVLECLAAVDKQGDFTVIGAIIAKDPLLTSRVLKLANSAAFPSRTPAITLEHAVVRMGTEGLTTALVQFSLHQAFSSPDDRIRAAFRGIWEHSLAVALLARDLAAAQGGVPDPNTAYLAGLLHDIGKPVIAALLLEAEKELTRGRAIAWMDEEVWKRVVDESHRDVGVALTRRWKLPDEVVRAVEDCRQYDRTEVRSCTNVVCLANALAKRVGLYVGEVKEAAVEQVVAEGVALLKLNSQTVDGICSDLHGRVSTLLDQPVPVRARG